MAITLYVVTSTEYYQRKTVSNLSGTHIDSIWTDRHAAEERALQVQTPYNQRGSYQRYVEGKVHVAQVEPGFTDHNTTFSSWNGERWEKGNLRIKEDREPAVYVSARYPQEEE